MRRSLSPLELSPVPSDDESNDSGQLDREFKITRLHQQYVRLLREGDLENLKSLFSDYISNGFEDRVKSFLSSTIKGKTNSALTLAVKQKKDDWVKYLVECGADVNLAREDDDMTPLMLAAKNDQESTIEILASQKNKLQLNKQNNQGESALMVAAKYGKVSAIFTLRKLGASLEVYDHFGRDVLMIAQANKQQESFKFILRLGDNIDFDREDRDGNTYLTMAARSGDQNLANSLIMAGANPNKISSSGYNPIFIALENRHDNLVMLLLSNGGKVDLTNIRKDSLLIAAVRSGASKKLVEELIARRLDVNHQNSRGSTALMEAVMRGNGGLVDILLINGAKIDTLNRDNRDAVSLAEDLKDNSILAKLHSVKSKESAKKQDPRKVEIGNDPKIVEISSAAGGQRVTRRNFHPFPEQGNPKKDIVSPAHISYKGDGERRGYSSASDESPEKPRVRKSKPQQDWQVEAYSSPVAKGARGIDRQEPTPHNLGRLFSAQSPISVKSTPKKDQSPHHSPYVMGLEMKELQPYAAFGDPLASSSSRYSPSVKPPETPNRLMMEKIARGKTQEVESLLRVSRSDLSELDLNHTLRFSARIGQVQVVEMLLEKGARINAADEKGNTALIDAASKGNFDIVELLVDKGADITHRNKDGHTAADIASQNRHRSIVSYFDSISKPAPTLFSSGLWSGLLAACSRPDEGPCQGR